MISEFAYKICNFTIAKVGYIFFKCEPKYKNRSGRTSSDHMQFFGEPLCHAVIHTATRQNDSLGSGQAPRRDTIGNRDRPLYSARRLTPVQRVENSILCALLQAHPN